MAILDYSAGLNAAGPQTTMQRTLGTAGMLQGLRANEQAMNQQKEAYDREQQMAQQEMAITKDAQDIYARGDVDEIAEFSIANPEHGRNILAQRGIVNQEGKQRVSDRFSDIYTSTDPQATLERKIQEGDDQGLDMTQSKEILAQNLPPEKVREAAGMALASIDGDRFKNIKSAMVQDDSNLPAETVAFNNLIKDFSPKEQNTAKRIKAGLKGRAVSNALLSAIESGDVKNLSQAKAEIKQAEKFAEATGSSRAKIIDKGFDSINKINSGIGNIDRAIAAIDKGAGSGVVEKMFPAIKAASVELDNIRGSMALDVVGATTFGALSKGELDLAKDIALPTGLDEPELKDYLQRKKAAQEKLRDYYNEQIQFLDQGGTVAGFLRSKQGANNSSQSNQGDMDNQALQWAQANPDDPRSAQILQKLQGKQ